VERKILIESTADGSNTLFVPELDEHYHSINGAVQESKYVFIEAGLRQCSKDYVSILEVGFGTGLNALLTLLEAEKSKKYIHYCGVELYPLPIDLIRKLNYTQDLPLSDQNLYLKLHEADWGINNNITNFFSIIKLAEDFTRLEKNLSDNFDLIYFDAFAPDKQSEMWTQDIFDLLYSKTTEGGILTTYCAKGIVRRMLQSAGYIVERLPGPPGKREMLRAVKRDK
jgi:tRNA U34 5-methylaminomethyl-2-thiouridine-forming methyltransferase MnmC